MKMLRDNIASVILIWSIISGSAKTSFGKGISYRQAKHYWPMNTSTLMDVRGASEAQTIPGDIKWKWTQQLGKVLELDGDDDYVKITGFKTKCITDPTQCKNGLSIGFWLNIYGGKYVLYGGQYGQDSRGAGYKIYQNTDKNQFIVEVATKGRVWKAFLHKVPLNWFHFIFSWSRVKGLRIYIDGRFVLQDSGPSSNAKTSHRYDQEIIIGRPDMFHEIGDYGRFDIGHLVIWDYAQNGMAIKNAYRSSIQHHPSSDDCCWKKENGEQCVTDPCYRFDFPKECSKVLGNKDCICVRIHDLSRQCENRQGKLTECEERRDDCKLLASQHGYCDYFQQEMESLCPASCKFCVPKPKAIRKGKSNKLPDDVLIFSLIGCAAGIIILFLVSIYSRHVYRRKTWMKRSTTYSITATPRDQPDSRPLSRDELDDQ